MKLPLATAVLSAALSAGCGSIGTEGHYALRVDRTLDRTSHPATYRDTTPSDRWNVTIDGSSVVLTAVGTPIPSFERIEGKEVSSTKANERRFELKAFAGGEFIIRGDEAELTIFGSGVPVIFSDMGKLVAY